MACPLGVAPTGANGVAWPSGDELLMKAAERKGFAYCMSSGSALPVERGREAAPTVPKIFQFYFTKFEAVNQKIVKQVEEAGFDAIAVTVDLPIYSKRLRPIRLGFEIPKHQPYVNLERHFTPSAY